MAQEVGALSEVRIVDLTDERAIYGAKLLADMGADIVRPESPDGDPLRKRGPFCEDDANEPSLWHAFFASNRRFVSLDLQTQSGLDQLTGLVRNADIVLVSEGAFGVAEANLDDALGVNPALVCVECSSFGLEGPWKSYLAPDIVAGALGGAVSTTGDVDTPPLKAFGDLNFIVSGSYVAIAALSALNHAKETGQGQRVHVPVHQCIASCLEHVFMWYWYSALLGAARGQALERRGSLHWSNMYVVMQALGGSIMVTPTPNIDAQLAWLIEAGEFEDLIEPKYQDPANQSQFMVRLMEVLRSFVGSKDVEALFLEAQSRHAPYGWVLPIEKVGENPQLEARDWWRSYSIGKHEVKGPGTPYRFSETPWQMKPYVDSDVDAEHILQDLGWDDDR